MTAKPSHRLSGPILLRASRERGESYGCPPNEPPKTGFQLFFLQTNGCETLRSRWHCGCVWLDIRRASI